MSEFMAWMTHGIKRGRSRMGQRAVLYSLVAIGTLTLITVLYLVLVSGTAAQGRRIQELQAEVFKLEREAQQLEVAVARAGSVSNLKERAREQGFVPAKEVEFLRVRLRGE